MIYKYFHFVSYDFSSWWCPLKLVSFLFCCSLSISYFWMSYIWIYWKIQDHEEFWFTPVFSPKSFIVSALTFRSLINFGLIFVYVLKQEAKFIFYLIVLHMDIQLSQHYLVNGLFFSHCMVLASLLKLVDYTCIVYFWTLNSISLIYMSIFVPVPQCLDYHSVEEILKLRNIPLMFLLGFFSYSS